MVDVEHNDVFAYTRTFGNEKVLVVANFRMESLTWLLPKGITLLRDRTLTSSYGGIHIMDGEVSLKPFEAFACFVE